MDVFVEFSRHTRRELDVYLRALERSGRVSAMACDDARRLLKTPTALRHLWTHRAVELDEEFFREAGRNGQETALIEFLDTVRDARIGRPFPLEQADVKFLGTGLFGVACRLAVERRAG